MNPDPDPRFQAPCAHLRNKEMYYQGFVEENEDYSSGVFWCTKTHEAFGPDGQPASKKECCAGRTCYID